MTPKKSLIANHLNYIGRSLDAQLGLYENFILMGDFNVEPNGKFFVKSTVPKMFSNIRSVSKLCEINWH